MKKTPAQKSPLSGKAAFPEAPSRGILHFAKAGSRKQERLGSCGFVSKLARPPQKEKKEIAGVLSALLQPSAKTGVLPPPQKKQEEEEEEEEEESIKFGGTPTVRLVVP